MKKKILIVIADYYKNISLNLIKSAKKEIKNLYIIKIKLSLLLLNNFKETSLIFKMYYANIYYGTLSTNCRALN